MKYALSGETKTPSNEVLSDLYIATGLIEATEGFSAAYEQLTDAQREMDSVCGIMDNINTSLALLDKFGDDAVAPLNVDKGLEQLIGIEEKLIKADAAQEGLKEAAKAAWETFKGWLKKLWDAIKAAWDKIVDWVKHGWAIITGKKEEYLKAKQEMKDNAEAAKLFGLISISNKGMRMMMPTGMVPSMQSLDIALEAIQLSPTHDGGIMKYDTVRGLEECFAEIKAHLNETAKLINDVKNGEKSPVWIDGINNRRKRTFSKLITKGVIGQEVRNWSINEGEHLQNDFKILTYTGTFNELGWTKEKSEEMLDRIDDTASRAKRMIEEIALQYYKMSKELNEIADSIEKDWIKSRGSTSEVQYTTLSAYRDAVRAYTRDAKDMMILAKAMERTVLYTYSVVHHGYMSLRARLFGGRTRAGKEWRKEGTDIRK